MGLGGHGSPSPLEVFLEELDDKEEEEGEQKGGCCFYGVAHLCGFKTVGKVGIVPGCCPPLWV